MTGRPVLLLQNELARDTYKPGYQMQIHDLLGFPQFELHLRTADSYHPDRIIALCYRAAVPPDLARLTAGRVDTDQFASWLAYTLREFEMHEAAEWHRRDGQLVNDPHTERSFGRPA